MEALFHCADGMAREAAGRILEIGLDRPKGPFLPQRGLKGEAPTVFVKLVDY